ncbi:hypothetical protein L7F22_058049 [Adiantum nelumboides]|nr:hypothetical protein [Adiantum nelumboides]
MHTQSLHGRCPPKYTCAIDALKQTLIAKGPHGLYKGMGAPLATVIAYPLLFLWADGSTALQLFWCPSYHFSTTYLCSLAIVVEASPSLVAIGVTGGSVGTGSMASKVVRYNGFMDVVHHVLQNEGGVIGLFTSLTPTLLREVFGNTVMFGVYEATKKLTIKATPSTQALYIDAFKKVYRVEGHKFLYKGFGPAMI